MNQATLHNTTIRVRIYRMYNTKEKTARISYATTTRLGTSPGSRHQSSKPSNNLSVKYCPYGIGSQLWSWVNINNTDGHPPVQSGLHINNKIRNNATIHIRNHFSFHLKSFSENVLIRFSNVAKPRFKPLSNAYHKTLQFINHFKYGKIIV